jgi:transcriptional regulator with XRE-family HTH domain
LCCCTYFASRVHQEDAEIARQLDALMENQGLTKSALAKRMKTSRAQLDRLLDPENESVTLGTLTRAAKAVGRKLKMELV